MPSPPYVYGQTSYASVYDRFLSSVSFADSAVTMNTSLVSLSNVTFSTATHSHTGTTTYAATSNMSMTPTFISPPTFTGGLKSTGSLALTGVGTITLGKALTVSGPTTFVGTMTTPSLVFPTNAMTVSIPNVVATTGDITLDAGQSVTIGTLSATALSGVALTATTATFSTATVASLICSNTTTTVGGTTALSGPARLTKALALPTNAVRSYTVTSLTTSRTLTGAELKGGKLSFASAPGPLTITLPTYSAIASAFGSAARYIYIQVFNPSLYTHTFAANTGVTNWATYATTVPPKRVATLIIREGSDTPGVFNYLTTTVTRATDNTVEDPQNITVATLVGAGLSTSNLKLNGAIPAVTVTGGNTATMAVTNSLITTTASFTISSTAASTATTLSTAGVTEIKSDAVYLTRVNPVASQTVSAAAEVNLNDALGKVVAITPNAGVDPDKFYVRRTSSSYTPWGVSKTDTAWGGEVTLIVDRGGDTNPVSIYYSIESDLGNPTLLTSLATGSTYTMHFYKDEAGLIKYVCTAPL